MQQYPKIENSLCTKNKVVISTLYWEVVVFNLRDKSIHTSNSRINKVRRFTKDELSQIV